ncbi:WD40 repeat domain-containing protein [Actinomadura sp. 7K534]|uniref:nSTAND1 domain-containing NTPase n=1 Tax=Actinomadura sp. 7K534 TaxID=2530366 RepID=UPI00104ED4A8|nr:WD40 repeat domain-containing protein [Actinomadura sp. 7K534]TDB99283.1 DNA-binding protein [Actinomadura sp. 7K534]
MSDAERDGHPSRTAAPTDAPPDGDACPYQGLAPFETERSELFFGRVRTTRALLDRLAPRLGERGSVLLVSGASGVGKSSLLRAGLLPALADGRLRVAGSRHWPRLLVTPTARPFEALAAAWAREFGGSREELCRRLREEPHRVRVESRMVLVVDQFEELFTLVTDEAERQAFAGALHALAEGPPGAAVVIGVRADYWDRCAAYPQFAEAIQDGQVIVEPMTESDLRLAITGPAAAAGLELEPGLVETILGELRADGGFEAGALPLLSQALRNTWERREDGRLTIRGYEETGRVHDSVRRTADAVLDGLPPADRKTALRLHRRMTLITPGGRIVRRKATTAELNAAAAADTAERRERVAALLSAFAGRRLLTLHEDGAEIAHDVLLTAWPALRQWLGPDLTAQAVYDRLIEDAAEWAENHRDQAFLYRGARLLALDDSRPRWERDPASFPPPGPTVTGFVAASAAAARRAGRRRRLVVSGLAVLTVLALVAAGAAVRAANQAGEQRRLALSRQLAAQSEVAGDPALSALLAVAAWQIAPTAEARHRLLATAARTGRGHLTGHEGFVRSLAFSPDGRMIATGGFDRTVRLWDPATRRQLGTPIAFKPGECGNDPPVAFSPDARLLATACLGSVRFWDVATHREVGAPLRSESGVSAIAFGPDGTLATGSLHGTVQLWDVNTRRPRGNVMGSIDRKLQHIVNAVAFSPDGTRLATASTDGTARLWDTATYEQVGHSLTGHDDNVTDVSFSPDGTTLATASLDGTARLWDVAGARQAGAALRSGSRASLYGVDFSSDGTRIVTAGADGSTRLWDPVSREQVGAPLRDTDFAVRAVEFSPGGTLFAAAGDDGVVRLGDSAAHQQIGGPVAGSATVAVSPDGRILATGGPSESDPAVRFWDVATRRPTGGPLESAAGAVSLIRFGSGGRTLLTADSDAIRTWDVASRKQSGSPVFAAKPHGRAELSPDGRLLAVEHGGAVLILDVEARRETGRRIRVPGHTEGVSALAFSPDGATLAIAGGERRVRLFDVATGRQTGAPLPVRTGGFVDDLAFSHDGRTLAVTADDQAVRLWDVPGRRPLGAALTGHTGAINAIAFSPDDTALASGSDDDTVRLWDLATHRQIGTPLTGHTRAVLDVAYTPDGSAVASVSGDGTARLWNVARPADPVGAACANAGRSLTPAEWKSYVPHEDFRRVCG